MEKSKHPEVIQIEIVNWEKYNPRKDIKNPHWFAFSNRFVDSDDYLVMGPHDVLMWLRMLSQASATGSPLIRCVVGAYQAKLKIKSKQFFKSLNMLESLGFVKQIRTQSVRNPNASVPTRHNNTRQDTTVHVVAPEKIEDPLGDQFSENRTKALLVLSEFFEHIPKRLENNAVRIYNYYGDEERMRKEFDALVESAQRAYPNDRARRWNLIIGSVMKELKSEHA